MWRTHPWSANSTGSDNSPVSAYPRACARRANTYTRVAVGDACPRARVGTSHAYAHAFVCVRRARTDTVRWVHRRRRQTRRHSLCRDIIGRLYVPHVRARTRWCPSRPRHAGMRVLLSQKREGLAARAFCSVKSNDFAVSTARGIPFASPEFPPSRTAWDAQISRSIDTQIGENSRFVLVISRQNSIISLS